VNDIIEIIKLVLSAGVFIAAISGVFKYFYEKNRELYISRLNEVYAPLVSYLIKQETVRYLFFKELTIKEAPILTWISEETTTNGTEITKKSKPILDRTYFIEILKNSNKGLIKPKLLKLLNAYEILIYLEETLKIDSDKWKIATNKKVNVEYELFREVQIGYEETIEKLKLDDKFEIFNLEDFTI